MQNIPTAKDPKELKKMYAERYGETAYEYKNNDYDFLEFTLLNDAYKEKFDDIVGLMGLTYTIEEVNKKIRQCLANNMLFDYGELPEGALI